MKIKCTTLFDITGSQISNRRMLLEPTFSKQRGQSSNFETILQVISLRSQPEEISIAVIDRIKFVDDDNWGYLFHNSLEEIPVWSFTFTISHTAVFDDGITPMGKLISDCEGIPMITGLDEWSKVGNQLNTSPELRNIYFTVV